MEFGKLADIVISSRDLTKGDPDTIDRIKVVKTIRERATVFQPAPAEHGQAEPRSAPASRRDQAFSPSLRAASKHMHVAAAGDDVLGHADSSDDGRGSDRRLCSGRAGVSAWLRQTIAALGVAFLVVAGPARAQDRAAGGPSGTSEEDLAKQLANPVAALISVPFQLNYDEDIGRLRDGDRWTLNVQPVVPIGLNPEWNLISRTIAPVVWQDDVVPGAGSQSGLGDVVQSFFLSPKAPTSGGWIWGAGPVLLLPTGTDELLTTGKWGAGPTGVALKQQGPWTFGVLANHIWSFAGSDSRPDLSATFLQPFVSYTTPDAWTLTVNTESTYDWKAEQWSVPVNFVVSKVAKLGGQLVSLGGGVRYWAESPDGSGRGWGARFVVTLLFPK